MSRCIISIWFLLFVSFSSYGAECVILLHGLARTDTSMSTLEKALIQHNYKTVNTKYPSRKYEIEELAMEVLPKAIDKCKASDTIHFVTHSMGGILVRQYLSTNSIDKLKNTVMLGPPNKGSEIVDKLSNLWVFNVINGPAGKQLGTAETSTPNSLGEANFNLGIIAGEKSVNPILSRLLPSPNDGKVSVESTKLEGMSDHISMPVSHTFMMNNDDVIRQILHFLEKGEFDKKNTDGVSK